MLQKPWFKVFVWFMATFFFFLAASVIISILKPGPSESEVMNYMMGMMTAMDQSLMGVIMGIEQDYALKNIIVLSYVMFIPIVLISIIVGLFIRIIRGGKKNV